MFKVGDKVRDTEVPSQGTETVKAVKQVWIVVTEEWPNLELPAERFMLANTEFPYSGARVRDKHTGEIGTIEAIGFNRGWYITLEDGRIEVPESYLLKHYEEDRGFPYVGAHWRRKGTPSVVDSNHGTIGPVTREGWHEVRYASGHTIGLSDRFIVDNFEEVR